MNTKDKIKNYISRALCLDSIPDVSESTLDAYWGIKKELFDTLTLWSYGNEMPYPKPMREDLAELNGVLESVWHKLCAKGLYY